MEEEEQVFQILSNETGEIKEEAANKQERTIEYLIIPPEIKDIISQTSNLNINKAYIIGEDKTPEGFHLGEGKRVFVLEYGIICIDTKTDEGFTWFVQDESKTICKKFNCQKLNDTFVKCEKCKTVTYCNEVCLKGDSELHKHFCK